MDLQHKTAKFEIKGGISDDGHFEGYASVFDIIDKGHDVVLKGAFLESIKVRNPKMLWQHDHWEIIGVWDEVREDDIGLFVKGRVLVDVSRGKDAITLLKAGAIDSMSIGYTVKESEDDGLVRSLKEVELYEVSLVTFPMLPDAKVTNVKSIGTERDFERFLRDAGYSRKQAKAITADGFKASAQWDADQDADETIALLELNQSLTALKETFHA